MALLCRPAGRSQASSNSPSLTARQDAARLQADALPALPRITLGLEANQEALIAVLQGCARIVNIVAPPGHGELSAGSGQLVCSACQRLYLQSEPWQRYENASHRA